MHIGSSISHYKIVEKLGEGGMGVVYKAEDTKLERTVALKFLAQHLLNDEEAKARFLREAKAAAALHHPNVCPVHEIDEVDGKTFLAMAYLKGETLEDRIAKGPLPIKDALDIARQVADGLQAAHAEGIVHRDIKPANILVSPEGRPTIMDFGLARLTEASRLTKVDTAMGTVAYMSPEQAQGMPVDHRTDLWALGCVLYEMVAGQRPFLGQYDQALLYEIVHEEVAPLTSVRAAVPMELEFVAGKCLAKDAADRYQHASDIAVDLRTLGDKLRSGRSTILRTANTGLAAPATANAAQTLNPALAPPQSSASRKWQVLAGVLAVALLAVSFAYFSASAPAPEPQDLRRFSFSHPNDIGAASISPDGRNVVFAALGANSALWLRSMESETLRELRGTEGNVSSAEDWDELLLPEIERQQAEGKQVTFRADAAFAKPEIYEALEERGVSYVIRIPANKNLEMDVADLLFRSPGRPSTKPLVRYKSFQYQAASWSKPRRIVAKVELHPGELFGRPGFIVTNMALPSRSVVRFYNKRGTAEQWIKEGKQATNWTRLSCRRFRSNEVRLQLAVLAYNLGDLWRRLGLPSRIKSWSLTSLQHRLMKTGGRLVKHARYYWLLLAEGHLNRKLFGEMLTRLAALPVPGG